MRNQNEIMKTKFLIVTMSDNSQWKIPAQFIADRRAKYYSEAECKKDPTLLLAVVYNREFEYTLKSNAEIIDWTSNNMNWCDVKDVAVEIPHKKKEPDYDNDWADAYKEVLTVEL
jgi:hypothetical protein